MKLLFNLEWTEFLSMLISHRVRLVLVGGHAVAAHAEPRLTEDLDVFVELTQEDARRLRSALVAFGFAGCHLATNPASLAPRRGRGEAAQGSLLK